MPTRLSGATGAGPARPEEQSLCSGGPPRRRSLSARFSRAEAAGVSAPSFRRGTRCLLAGPEPGNSPGRSAATCSDCACDARRAPLQAVQAAGLGSRQAGLAGWALATPISSRRLPLRPPILAAVSRKHSRGSMYVLDLVVH